MITRDEKDEAEAIMKDYLHILRSQFYTEDEGRFYKHKFMLMQAIACPAKWLKKMGVGLPGKRLREILSDIIRGIKQKGNTGNVEHFAAYFLTCVQSHMRKRNEIYYNEAKTAASAAVAKMPLEAILQGAKVVETEPPTRTVERLVEIAAAFKPRRRAKVEAKQMDFGL